MQDPIRLKHFRLWEILQKIDLLEGEYDLPLRFDGSRIPSAPAAAGQNTGEWGYGMAVYGAARGHRQSKQMPSLMVDLYGFSCEEEMVDTNQYLREHGSYQLEQVSVKQLVALLFFLSFRLVTLMVNRGGKVTGHFLLF